MVRQWADSWPDRLAYPGASSPARPWRAMPASPGRTLRRSVPCPRRSLSRRRFAIGKANPMPRDRDDLDPDRRTARSACEIEGMGVFTGQGFRYDEGPIREGERLSLENRCKDGNIKPPARKGSPIKIAQELGQPAGPDGRANPPNGPRCSPTDRPIEMARIGEQPGVKSHHGQGMIDRAISDQGKGVAGRDPFDLDFFARVKFGLGDLADVGDE